MFGRPSKSASQEMEVHVEPDEEDRFKLVAIGPIGQIGMNQCDGCKAGKPVDKNGNHRMGEPGKYPDLMGCTAHLYKDVHFENCRGPYGGACDVCWLKDFIDNVGLDHLIKPLPNDGIFHDRKYRVTGRLIGEFTNTSDGCDYDEWFESSGVTER